MKYLKYFKNTDNSIDEICEKYNIYNYIINNDGSIDVDGDVNLSYKNLTEIPLNFNVVTGYFRCSNNPNLKSLKGSPKQCSNFYCYETAIESLEFSPMIVSDYFYCSYNPNLKSLKSGPKKCNEYYCYDNPLIKTFDGLENTICEYYHFVDSPINNLYILFKDPKRINEFIDLEIIDEVIIKQYRLEHFLDRKLTREEINNIKKYYYLL